MLFQPPTERELRAVFEGVLDDIVTGKAFACPTDTGLDEEVYDILNHLGQQPDPKSPADIAACRTEFARQLDGTHRAELLA